MARDANNNKGNHNNIPEDVHSLHDSINEDNDNWDLQTSTDGNSVSTGDNSEGKEEPRTELSEASGRTDSNSGNDIVAVPTDIDTTDKNKGKVRRRYAVNDLVARKTAILMIFTLRKAGIKDRQEIRNLIEAHGLLQSNNKDGKSELFNEYIKRATEMEMEDYSHTAWVTYKIQTGWNEDYHEEISILDDRISQNIENCEFYQKWIRELKEANSKDSTILAVTAIRDKLDSTVSTLLKDKRAMIESGPMFYKTKKYIDTVHEILESRGIHVEKSEILPSGNVLDHIDGSPRKKVKKEPEVTVNEDGETELAPHLKKIEKEMGKPISDE